MHRGRITYYQIRGPCAQYCEDAAHGTPSTGRWAGELLPPTRLIGWEQQQLEIVACGMLYRGLHFLTFNSFLSLSLIVSNEFCLSSFSNVRNNIPHTMKSKHPYRVLGISQSASPGEIYGTYKRRMRETLRSGGAIKRSRTWGTRIDGSRWT